MTRTSSQREIDDAVEVSRDGLVCPGISDTGAQVLCFLLHSFINKIITITELSNGAVFMPNTRFMQELTRLSYDNYLDSVRDGHPSGDPHYLSIPKGRMISDSNRMEMLNRKTEQWKYLPEAALTQRAHWQEDAHNDLLRWQLVYCEPVEVDNHDHHCERNTDAP